MRLTKIQKQIMEDFHHKEYIRLNDFWRYYSTQISVANTIKRFIILGIITDVGNERFKFNEEHI